DGSKSPACLCATQSLTARRDRLQRSPFRPSPHPNPLRHASGAGFARVCTPTPCRVQLPAPERRGPRFLQKVIERSSLQGRDTKFRENFLLTNAQTQRAIAGLSSAGFVRRGLDNGFPWSVRRHV